MLFAAIYIPDFPVEALVRAEPELREQAVAVVEGTPPLVHVVAVNERAAQAGVEPGMTRLQAEERMKAAGASHQSSGKSAAGEGARATTSRGSETRATPTRAAPTQGTVRERSRERETAAHAALLDCACGFSPRVEDTAADTVVLDLAGLERIFGPPAKMARDVARRCSEMGLEANVAVASNADTAALAARGFAGVTVIAEGKEAERLGELGVEILLATDWGETLPIADCRLPIGSHRQSTIDNQKWCEERQGLPGGAPAALELLETLERWGVRNLRALAALPEVALAERLGQEGLRLQKLARGETRRPLVVAEPPLRFEEAAELEYPVDILEPLAFLLNRMLEQLCARLAARALATNELKLKLELEANEDRVIGRSGDHPSRLTAGLPGTPGDRVMENPAQITGSPDHQITRCLRLPVAMLDAKVFLKLLQLDLQAHPPTAPVTKVWLRAEPAEPRKTQNGLFAPEAPEAEKLSVTLARIARVVGGSCENNPHPISPPRYASGQSPPCEIRVGQPHQEEASQQVGVERVGSPEIVDTHCPGAFRMKPFAAGEGARGPGNFRPIECSPGEAPGPTATRSGPTATPRSPVAPGPTAQENRQSTIGNRKWGEEQQDALGGERAPTSMVALRMFRPALAAVVTVREGKPAQVASAERPTLRGEVVWCAGPWRWSGEWWTEQAWRREEWDVAVRNEEGVALYRVYRDEIGGRWWVEGSYD